MHTKVDTYPETGTVKSKQIIELLAFQDNLVEASFDGINAFVVFPEAGKPAPGLGLI